MSLKEKLSASMKDAMKARDQVNDEEMALAIRDMGIDPDSPNPATA